MHVFAFIGWLGQLIVFLAFYSGVAGLVYGRTNLHFKRFTNATASDASHYAMISAIAWPFTVPWYLLARLAGFVDPNIRAAKAAAEKEEQARLDKRVSQAETEAQMAALQEDAVTRMRARLAGEDLPVTAGEQMALESIQGKEERERLQRELADKQRQLKQYRGY